MHSTVFNISLINQTNQIKAAPLNSGTPGNVASSCINIVSIYVKL